MRFSESAITDFMSRGDFTSVIRVFRSLQREVDTKDDLITEYIKDMSHLMSAFKELEEQRDGLRRVSAALKKLCREHGLSEEQLTSAQVLANPEVENLEELAPVEDSGEPGELLPE